MQLELKNIAKYLPYGLKYLSYDDRGELIISSNGIYKNHAHIVHLGNCELLIDIPDSFTIILRPLSDLTKEITHNGETFIPSEVLNDKYGDSKFETTIVIHPTENDFTLCVRTYGTGYYALPLSAYEKLLEWHFDLDNLIENNLAINVNDLKENPYE